MKLNLKKPLVVFDLETTGVNITQDHIIEIGYIKVEPNGNEKAESIRINPGIHIPEESTKVHGITDDDVKDCPTFKEKAQELANTFKGCDFAGFNSNHFDVPMLAEEFLRADVDFDFTKAKFIDVQNIFHKKEQRTLVAAYKFYVSDEGFKAHAALDDTRATYEVLMAQLDRYKDDDVDPLKNDVEYLAAYSSNSHNVDLAGRIVYNEKKIMVFNFGKYKGQPVTSVLDNDPGYYGWMMKGDFAQNTKQVLTKIRLEHSMKK